MVSHTPSGRIIWNDEAHANLLVAMVQNAPPNDDQWHGIQQTLREHGFTCTIVAYKQHLMKLQKKMFQALQSSASGAGAPKGRQNHQSRETSGGMSRPGKKRSFSRSQHAHSHDDDDDDDGDDDDFADDGPSHVWDGDVPETPSKRIKRADTQDVDEIVDIRAYRAARRGNATAHARSAAPAPRPNLGTGGYRSVDDNIDYAAAPRAAMRTPHGYPQGRGGRTLDGSRYPNRWQHQNVEIDPNDNWARYPAHFAHARRQSDSAARWQCESDEAGHPSAWHAPSSDASPRENKEDSDYGPQRDEV
ncbi:hypothetical protein AB5N19_13256 [Seiridium cardinale]